MICTCGCSMVRAWIPWQRRRGWLCTICGRLWRLDYLTGRRIEIWPARRYGRRKAA